MPTSGANGEPRLDSDEGGQFLLSGERSLLVFSAWVSILLISDVPDVIWDSLSGRVPQWLFWGKTGVLAFLFGVCLVWKRIRPLLQFAGVMFVFYLALLASTWVGSTPWWES